MTTGALIFAFNNEQTDYVSMAVWCARRIRYHLNIPVALVTDSADTSLDKQFELVVPAQADSGGTRYFEDYATSVTWHNANRCTAYDLSPWKRTLVIDADFVIDSSDLKTVLRSQQDFLCFRHAYDVTQDQDILFPTFGRYNFPMWWATVMIFNRSNTAQYIFDAMSMVQQNWQHYRDLYGIDQANFRNDYALSIALGIVSGHTLQVDSIPWKMATVMPNATLDLLNHEWLINYKDQREKSRFIMMNGTDFHAMGKRHLEAVIASS